MPSGASHTVGPMGIPFRLASCFRRDEELFRLFDELAGNIAEAARLLRGIVGGEVDEVSSRGIRRCERRGDELTAAIGGFAQQAIVTPFDRDDILRLSYRLNSVVDDVAAVAELLVSYELTGSPADVDVLADLLMKSAEANVSLIAKLATMRGLRPDLEVIDALGRDAHHVYRRSVAQLSGAELQTLDVLVTRHIARTMDSAITAMTASSRIVRSIKVKHA